MKTAKTTRKRIPNRYLAVLATIIALTSLCPAAPEKTPRKKFPMSSRDKWQQADRVVLDLGLKEGTSVADVGC